MERTFWDKLRILVTNKCNYECPFCHNEGQLKAEALNMMSFDDFKTLIDILNGQIISELHFSGGEPFLNKDIVKMIEYVDKNTITPLDDGYISEMKSIFQVFGEFNFNDQSMDDDYDKEYYKQMYFFT